MNAATQMAIWAEAIGQPVDPGVLFHPDFIDRFVTEGCAHLRSGTQLNYRRDLRTIGTQVLGRSIYPPRPLPLRRDELLAPYSTREVTALVAWCRGLPTAQFRDNTIAIVALGVGAGLKNQEMSKLVGDDVVADGDGVVIDVIGSRARKVPVRKDWAALIHTRAIEVGARPFLFPGRTRITRCQLSNFVERCPRGDAPKLDTQRLRNTWIVDQLSQNTHLSILAEAAGVGPDQIVRYLSFAERPDVAEARRQLQRAGP
jgi:hypothetical protein